MSAERIDKETMKCSCGNLMTRGSGYFDTDFKCDRCEKEYNGSGQSLAPRSQWGEETGETF